MTSIMWFTKDLRLYDNPALFYSAGEGPIIPVYVFDKSKVGEASRWWLHNSLEKLQKEIKINIFAGKAEEVLMELCQKYSIFSIYYNRTYEYELDHRKFSEKGIKLYEFNGNLLHEPELLLNDQDTNYKVFTPFWKKLQSLVIRTPFPKPKQIDIAKNILPGAEVNILPENGWYHKLEDLWQVGEEEALRKLDDFVENNLISYKINRDYCALKSTSLLSPHLAHGEISPVTIWHKLLNYPRSEGAICFQSELGWREFSYYQLHYNPDLSYAPQNKKFLNYPWQYDKKLFSAWTKGETGFDLVDAGMKQLWNTGWMHNRIRMITASFLVKNLLIPWQEGAKWFMNCLVDADIASNSASWQWVAGCGADAAPFFRIFNPELQKEKFDPQGKYIQRYLGSSKHLKIIDYNNSRKRALDLLKSL